MVEWGGAGRNDLISLVYGCIVRNALDAAGRDQAAAAGALERIGEELAGRLVDQFLVQAGVSVCPRFADSVALLRQALRQFLGVEAAAEPEGEDCFVLTVPANPLEQGLALPPELTGFPYSAALAGAVRGAFAAVGLNVRPTLLSAAGETPLRLRVELRGAIHRQLRGYDT